MSLTRKHFIELAKIINDAREYIPKDKLLKIQDRIATYCASENYDFDWDRFDEACGLNDEDCDKCKGTQYFYNDHTGSMEICDHKK